MSGGRRRAAAVVAAFLVGTACGSAAGADGEPQDLQSHEVLSYDCTSELGRRDVTLFANGTVRLRQGLYADGERTLHLEELTPEELAAVMTRLHEIADDDAMGQAPLFPMSGVWTERCTLVLALPERDAETMELASTDALPGRVGRLVQVAEDLVAELVPVGEGGRLPVGHEPAVGDVFTDPQGHRWRVMRFTVGETGVELDGLDQPLRIYVAVDQLPEAFVAVEPAVSPFDR